jgi:tetratricopeptide (TPR) repeat protein
MPEKAARLTEQWIAEDKIEADGKTLRQLGDLWLLSREREKAKGYLRRAATTSKDPDTFELLASLHFEDEEWRDAYSNFVTVLDFDGRRDDEGERIEIDDPLRIHMLAGISAFRAGMNAEARRSLRRAMDDPGLRSQARAMLAQID